MRAIAALTALILLTSCASTPAASTSAQCAALAEADVPRYVDGRDFTAPKVLHRVNPTAPRELVGKTATATVEFIVGEDGVPRHVCAIAGDPTWGAQLAQAVRQWKFAPATRDGKPIAVRFQIDSVFRGQ